LLSVARALIVIQRQLGHTNLGITSIYLQGTDNTEIIDTVHARRAPRADGPRPQLAPALSYGVAAGSRHPRLLVQARPEQPTG
jgi:hypothetical protein